MKLMVMATHLNGGQDRNLDTEYLSQLGNDVKEKLNGFPREDVLLVLLDAGNDKIQEMAASIKKILEIQ